MESTSLKTPLGIVTIQGDMNGITAISIAETSKTLIKEIPSSLQKCVVQLQEYFDGNRNRFDIALNPQGTDFQKRVWQALLEIPFGKTTSYLELSKKLGNAKTVRAVAAANGKNPLWIIIPCHRVIGTDGSLTGYAGGLWRKKWLLNHENPSTQVSLF
ncbi:MAG: cysteine methyltransferase [Bacteroidetes bacterium HGW-Bacteroidetes-2]|nr:MAG: cysteine methyltransferase [Bacteroidetes bacterium HGW-Bacteroidetes-2]